MIVRGPLTTVAHVVFGSLWAIRFNKTNSPAKRVLYGLAGLTGAALLHGTYNVLAFSGLGLPLAVLLVIIGAILVFRAFRRTRESSNYHLRRNVPLQVCSVCANGFRRDDNFCPGCGRPVWQVRSSQLMCANCSQVASADARFCTGCGDLFVFEE